MAGNDATVGMLLLEVAEEEGATEGANLGPMRGGGGSFGGVAAVGTATALAGKQSNARSAFGQAIISKPREQT